MFEVRKLYDGLPLLLALLCVVIAKRYYVSFFDILRSNRKPQAPLTSTEPTPEIDGSHLYYGRTKWPQYEATFNLRLSYLYGPVTFIKHSPEKLLTRALRWVNRALCRDWVPSDTTVLINSLSDNETVLKKLLGSCASRSPSIATGKYLSRGRRIVLQPYGPVWVRYRRAFSSLLTKEKINTRWAKVFRSEAMIMVDRIANLSSVPSPPGTNCLDEIFRFTASSVLQITYARRAPTPHDQVLKDLGIVSQNIADAFTPGKYWVEEFPFLEVFPSRISPWKKRLDTCHRFELGLFRKLLHDAERYLGGEESVSRGSVRDLPSAAWESVIAPEECAAAELLRNKENLGLERDDIAYLAAGIFEAGTETTAVTIYTFLLAAASYPEMTSRAQAEIDHAMDGQICAENSVPTFKDLQQMPYLAAVVKETLRLTPTGSSGVGHTSAQAQPQTLELALKGGKGTVQLTIPCGATVLANTYGIHHDPEQFPDPWRFNPDRWLPSNPDAHARCHSELQHLEVSNVSLDHTHANYAFGFGRRICPGSSLASYSLSMSIAMLLLCFDFEFTEKAKLHYIELEKQQRAEHRKWDELFPSQNKDTLERERFLQRNCRDERDQIGRVLIDAHIAFKLSRRQLAECIRLQPQKQNHGVRAVREALAMMQHA